MASAAIASPAQSALRISSHPTEGHGEYIVYKQDASGAAVPLSQEQYKKIFRILTVDIRAIAESRLDFIKRELRAIDPSLQVAFVPRILYELIFMHECMQEEITNRRSCIQRQLYKDYHSYVVTEEEKHEILEKKHQSGKCYHLCCFEDRAEDPEKDIYFSNVAYRINNIILRKLFPEGAPVSTTTSYAELSDLLEEELNFFRDFYKYPTFCDGACGDYTLIDSFSDKGNGGRRPSLPLGIRNHADLSVIRNAFTIECSDAAKDAFVLYRGARYSRDNIYYDYTEEKIPKSLSYGLGLFSGGLYDGNAAPFHYMKQDSTDGFALIVPKGEFKTSPFFLPFSPSAPYQLLARGEFFHPRNRIWMTKSTRNDDGSLETPPGVYGEYGEKRKKQQALLERLYCVKPDDVDGTISSFAAYHNAAIQLKRGPLPMMLVDSAPKVSIAAITDADISLPAEKCCEITYDAGYGFSIELRGDGPGMSWERGIPLKWNEGNKWTAAICIPKDASFSYKFVLRAPSGEITYETSDNRSYKSGFEERALRFA